MLALGIDIGGTFTDLILFDSDRQTMQAAKVPSVPGRQWEGLEHGLDALGIDAAQLGLVVHGTTVATNAMLEGKGARTALLTTSGFRDLIEIGRCMRLQPGSLFQTHFRRPPPLVPRDRRLELKERIGPDGAVIDTLEEADVQRAAREIAGMGVQAVAVCLINAFANPAHEEAVARSLRGAGLAAPIYRSGEVSPEYREYERLTTTLINASVSPVMDRYLHAFEDVLTRRGFAGQLLVMSSNGGTVGRSLAGRMGAQSILSGPVGGIRGAAVAAPGEARLITLDIGGTSTDVALIDGAEPRMTQVRPIGGFPLRLPQLEITTVGAGGGSLARVDEGGSLLVGPQSAGADPGPACYGRGNTQPTVTDANLVLGRLGETLLGGALALNPALAYDAVAGLAATTGMETMALAEGIVAIAVAHMANAIREVSVQQGADPRDFALVAFGGAGPLHACLVADELGMSTVLVPPHPGNTCAYGLLASGLRRDAARTWLRPLPSLAPAELRAELEALGATLLAELDAGWPKPATTLGYALDLRYAGQAFEVTIPIPDLTDATLLTVPDRFGAQHERIYGHRHDRDLEVVNLRVVATAPAPARFALPPVETQEQSPGTRRVYCDGGWTECPVLHRVALAFGMPVHGPAVVEEVGSTTWLPPGWVLHPGTHGTLRLSRA